LAIVEGGVKTEDDEKLSWALNRMEMGYGLMIAAQNAPQD
jgi:hypothetical protein